MSIVDGLIPALLRGRRDEPRGEQKKKVVRKGKERALLQLRAEFNVARRRV